MASLDTTTAAEALKTFYGPRMNKLINQMSVLYMRLDKKAGVWNVEGKNWTLGLHTGRNNQAGIGVAELGTIPDPDHQKYNSSVVPGKQIYTPIELSGVVVRAAKSDAGSFVRAIRSEVEGATMDTKRSVNRQINGNGTDAFGYYVSGTGTGAGVMNDGYGHVFTHMPPEALSMDLIDASTGGTATVLDSAVAVTLGSEGATGYAFTYGSGNIDATADAGTGVGDADYYVRTGTIGKQLMGITGIIANTELRFPLMQRVISKIGMNSNFTEDAVDFIHTSPFGRDKYVELCTNERRTFNRMKLDGGFEGVSYNNIVLVADPQALIGRYNFIVTEALKITRLMDFEWIDDGSGTLRKVSGKDAFEGLYAAYINLATTARNALGALIGINME